MRYIVSLSGGLGSAVTAEKTIERYGRSKVDLWFADTNWEDDDLHRFMGDCMKRWGGKLHTFKDGRTPLEVASDAKIIPNPMIAPCSYVLKVQPFEAFLWKNPRPVTVMLGLGWHEPHRIKSRRNYTRRMGKPKVPSGYPRRIPGVYEDFPLMWQPLDLRPAEQIVSSWGIRIPDLYLEGAPHNNCGRRCVKQGMKEWLYLLKTRPDSFAEVRDWEEEQRAKGGARANRAILRDRKGGVSKPLTLAELQRQNPDGLIQPNMPIDDQFSCACTEM